MKISGKCDDYGVLRQNKPTQLSKLSRVCVGYWYRMWVEFSLLTEFSIITERLKSCFWALFSRGVVRCLVSANFGWPLMYPKYLSTWFVHLSFKM